MLIAFDPGDFLLSLLLFCLVLEVWLEVDAGFGSNAGGFVIGLGCFEEFEVLLGAPWGKGYFWVLLIHYKIFRSVAICKYTVWIKGNKLNS